MLYFDTHAHYDWKEFDEDRSELFNKFKESLCGIVNIGINIDKCIKTNYGFCIECEDGYYYNKYNGTCLKMHDNFMNCKITCDYGDKCCECKDNFYLYEFDNLCYDNTKEENFIKCAHVNINETCDSCHDGYY